MEKTLFKPLIGADFFEKVSEDGLVKTIIEANKEFYGSAFERLTEIANTNRVFIEALAENHQTFVKGSIEQTKEYYGSFFKK